MERLRRFKQFLLEVWVELKKTTWPSRQEVYGTTVVVIVTVIICAIYLWIVDLFLSKSMSAVYRVFE